ncbi:immunoglobulin-like domain-containing receptor 1 isoform X1 [Protopterus annectens]|uniref:immunoglobulin-like domain-containing receptor 1 isoform X1 n=1 Tax=Protopterus annectens TaxID=7888 RepID=UPI001CF9E342|nr:immunoglobulin-like domain-containing receptor 1 isoform X1 [Protopterus annectens]
MKFGAACFYLSWMSTGCFALLVSVEQSVRYVTMFASVTIRCDYTTSAQQQDVTVKWMFKSFCKDPILDYYSAAYQAALGLSQDPMNDCPDSQRVVRVVLQKSGQNEPILGGEYQQRKITIQDRANLVISEVMWWDHGVYYCTVEARGDTIGDPDKEVRLIVLNWLTIIFIILGGVLLFSLIGICVCQCCPQACCCYLRCPCCPTKCCCPEKAILRNKLMKDMKKGILPLMTDKPGYINGHYSLPSSTYQLNPLLQRGYPQASSYPIQMAPLPDPRQAAATNKVVDYLENEVKNLNIHQLHQTSAPFNGSHHPSMLSSLNDVEVREVERRVIHLPPIIERVSNSARNSGSSRQRNNYPGQREPSDNEFNRRNQRPRSLESSHSRRDNSRGPFQDRRWGEREVASRRDTYEGRPVSPRRHHPSQQRSYSDESDYEDRRGYSGYRQRRRHSEEDHFQDRQTDRRRHSPERWYNRRERGRSPPAQRDSWSSDDEYDRRQSPKARQYDQVKDSFLEKPPSYHSIEVHPGQSDARRTVNDRQSERGSSRSGRSVMI